MSYTITAGTPVTSSTSPVAVPLPARVPGDYIQFVLVSARNLVWQGNSIGAYDKIVDVAGVVEVHQKLVTATGGDGSIVNVNLSGTGGTATIFAQIIHVEGENPNTPGGNEALRQALLGIATGSFSSLPFNSSVTPSGRGGRLGAPDGYQYLSDVVATQRGVGFDVMSGFQYQNRSISEGSTAWNDLIGLQVFDWFDPKYPVVMAMEPFPFGGSYTAAKNGSYDAQYIAIGQSLAQKRPAGTGMPWLRFGWEMNGNWYDHAAFRYVDDDNPFVPVADYVAGTQRAISKIREGANGRVKFTQCWSASQNDRYLSTYWGDSYADAISVDVYDDFAGTNNGIHTEAQLLNTGLGEMFQFAKDHGKLLGIDEWGGHATAGSSTDGEDNPDFPIVFYTWVNANRDSILWESQFNDNGVNNVENNLWSTNDQPIQLPSQRAALISKVQSLKV